MTESSTFRIKCGDDGFHQDSLDVSHQSSTGDLHRARQLRQHVVGSQQVAFSVMNSLVLCTLKDPELNAVYNGNADV